MVPDPCPLLLALTPLEKDLEFLEPDADDDDDEVVEEAPWALIKAECPDLDTGFPSVLQSWSSGCRCLRQ